MNFQANLILVKFRKHSQQTVKRYDETHTAHDNTTAETIKLVDLLQC